MRFALLAILTVAAPSVAAADEPARPQVRVALSSVLYQHSAMQGGDGFTFDVTSLGARSSGLVVGWLPAPWLEVGGQVYFLAGDAFNGDLDSHLYLALYADGNIQVARGVVLHAGAFGGLAQVRDGHDDGYDENGWHAGAGGGAKLFVTERGSIDLGVRGFYSTVSEEWFWEVNQLEVGHLQVTAGVSLWL